MKSYFTRLSFLLTLLLFLSSCSLFQDIQIKNVTDFAPAFEDKQLLIKANISVQNDNLYAIKLNNITHTINADTQI